MHCDIETASGKLLPGMFVNAEIQLDNIKVPALPEDAVVKWNNKTYVFVEEDTATYRMTAVETGSIVNGYIEITSILPEKNIATANAYTLLTKLKNAESEE